MFITALFGTPLVTFSPVLVREVFHGGAVQFSATVAAFGVGGLLGATALLGIPPHIDRRWLTAGSALVYGVVVILAAINPWYGALPLLFAVAGASMTISNTAANTLLQASTEPRLLGRSVALYQLVMRGGMSLGALISGGEVSVMGVQRALLLNGILAVVTQAAVTRRGYR